MGNTHGNHGWKRTWLPTWDDNHPLHARLGVCRAYHLYPSVRSSNVFFSEDNTKTFDWSGHFLANAVKRRWLGQQQSEGQLHDPAPVSISVDCSLHLRAKASFF